MPELTAARIEIDCSPIAAIPAYIAFKGSTFSKGLFRGTENFLILSNINNSYNPEIIKQENVREKYGNGDIISVTGKMYYKFTFKSEGARAEKIREMVDLLNNEVIKQEVTIRDYCNLYIANNTNPVINTDANGLKYVVRKGRLRYNQASKNQFLVNSNLYSLEGLELSFLEF